MFAGKKILLLLSPLCLLLVTSYFLLKHNSVSSAQVATPPSIVICPNCSLPQIGNRLRNKNLTDSYLQNTSFGSSVPGSPVVNASDAIFNGSYMDGGGFAQGSILDSSKFRNASLVGFTFTNTQGVNVSFRNSDLSSAEFSNSVFQNGNFIGSTIQGANFDSANMSGANMTSVIVNGSSTNFSNTNLTNVNFTNANLNGAINMNTANITGVIWSNTVCPDGTNSNSNGNTCVGHF